MTYETWNLKDRQPIVRRFTSGAWKSFSVRIRWSNKLGLEYHVEFDDEDSAEHVRLATVNNGNINTKEWRTVFYPGTRWLDHYAD